MDLRFNTSLAEGYKSASQIARVLTEDWLARNMYCPICGEVTIRRAEPNAPVKDYVCEHCKSQYELKRALQILSVDSPRKSVSQISSCNGKLFKIIV